jgi:enoyl-CoA hydratase/carnithine racemase
MDEQAVLYEVGPHGVATVTLNRPEQLNAMNRAMSVELMAAIDRADEDPAVRVVILTGNGRAFCAGADLSVGHGVFVPTSGAEAHDVPSGRDWGGVLVLRLFAANKPLIAAVNGAAVGVGATMTLPCDVRLASTAARFGFVFARRGIVTDGCASWFLPRVVGPSTALRWCLTGRVFPAEEALGGGLVTSLHEPDELLASARELAAEIAESTAAVSVALTRRLLWQGLVSGHPIESHAYESALLGEVARGDDAREGVASFLEKRAPRFPGTVPGSMPARWPLWEEPAYPAGKA